MLRKSLASLPRTLDQTYDRILTAIGEEYSKYAMRILQWLTFSARPLSVEEVAEVVAIDVARDLAFDCDEVLEDPLEALNICSSLVTITTSKAEGEYLMSDRIKQGQARQYSMQEVECHNAITKGSLMYLSQFQQLLSTKVLETSALARYAAQFWSSHIRNAGDETEASLLAMSLMSADNTAYLTWIQLWDPDHPWREPGLKSILYYNQGWLGEAEKMYERALRGKEGALGVGHSSTLNTVNNLGLLYKNQGRLWEAEKMYDRALRGYEELGGVRVQQYLPALNTLQNMGDLYAKQGESAKARAVYTRALSGLSSVLGASSERCMGLVIKIDALPSASREREGQSKLATEEERSAPQHDRRKKSSGLSIRRLVRKICQ
ncbi:unnamed protein product [Alternaria alternata]